MTETPGLRRVAVPRSVGWISALWVTLLLGASVVWPVTYGIDENDHFDAVITYSAAPFHFYGPGQMHQTAARLGYQAIMPASPGDPKLDLAPFTPRSQRPSVAQLGGATHPDTSPPNQMEQHPPLYYELGAVVLAIPGVSSLAWDLQLWLVRLLSVAIMSPVPLLCWAATRRLLASRAPDDLLAPGGAARSGAAGSGAAGSGAAVRSEWLSRMAVLGALVPLTIPDLVREGGSVTNDTLLISTSSVLLYLLTRVMTGDRSLRTAAWVAVSLVTALLTKGFALVFPPIILLAYLIGSREAGGSARRPRLPWKALGIVFAGAVIGGLWWLRNLVEYGTVQVNGYGAALQHQLFGVPDNTGTLYRFVPRFAYEVFFRLWGETGLPDLPSPGPLVVWGWLAVAALGVAAALGGSRRDRYRSVTLLLVPVLTLLVVAVGSYGDFRHWSEVTRGTQGRYLLHTVVIIAALATVGWVRLLQPRMRARLLLITLVGALATNSATWLLIVHSWYSSEHGLGGLVHGVRTVFKWAPTPEPVTIALLLALPVALSLLSLWAVAGDARWLGTADRTAQGDRAAQGDQAAQPGARSGPPASIDAPAGVV